MPLLRRLLTAYLSISAVALQGFLIVQAGDGGGPFVAAAIGAVLLGHLVVGWRWPRLWLVTALSVVVLAAALWVLPVPHPALGLLFAVVAKASLDPVGLRACALCGCALAAYLIVVVALGVGPALPAAAWGTALAPVPGMVVSVAALRLLADATLARDRAVLRLTTLIQRDGLTGAVSRAHFLDLLDRAVVDRPGSGGPAVLVLDVDEFKIINDTFGHVVGDELLRVVAVRSAAVLAGCGVVARLGGDEFAVLVPDGTTSQVLGLVDRMREALHRPAPIAGAVLHPRVSIGVAVADGVEPITSTGLLDRADLDMYVAKRRRAGTRGTTVRRFG